MTLAAATHPRCSADSQCPPQPPTKAEGLPVEALLLPGQRLEQQRAAAVSYVNTGNAVRAVLRDGVQVN